MTNKSNFCFLMLSYSCLIKNGLGATFAFDLFYFINNRLILQ